MSGYLFCVLIVIFFGLGVGLRKFLFGYSEKREFRKCESPIEEKLFKLLREQGYKVYTQVQCGKYRIDLVLYKGRKKYALEADGEEFHTSPEQRTHDRKKNLYLKKMGWSVIRLAGTHIHSNPSYCLKVIRERMK
jgi:very-short-patch-repair endonuclease